MNKDNTYKPLLVIITGPTASGKTALSVRIAEKLNCKIISADSRQFYKGMSIGTAAPTQEELNKVKHYFIGHLNIDDKYNVSKYETDVDELLKEIFSTDKIVMLTGGSGLYIDAVCNGIDDIPSPPPALRKSLHYRYQKKGLEDLRLQLKLLDPEYYNNVDIKNPGRIIRALEVCLTSGKTYTSFRKHKLKKNNYRILKIGIETDRKILHTRINNRVDNMIKEGLVDEVKSLTKWRHCNALNTVGYKEIFSFLDGNISLVDAIEKIKTNTRRYARRQITWFNKDKDIKWFSLDEEDKIMEIIMKSL